ncbi:MAG: hypothetical protein IPH35_18760, partial [Rhodoferax sp.]|nr:hypothetical protein [Rhodoferax sp.]
QALALEQALQRAGVHTRCEITQGHWHVAQMHAGALASADEALASMARFVASIVPPVKPGFTHTVRSAEALCAFGYGGAC